jgi:hypothetical protein
MVLGAEEGEEEVRVEHYEVRKVGVILREYMMLRMILRT